MPAQKQSLHASAQNPERLQRPPTASGQATAALEPERFTFLEEAGINRAMTRWYGQALCGQRSEAKGLRP
jgi:hypothetical protein